MTTLLTIIDSGACDIYAVAVLMIAIAILIFERR